MDRLLFMDSKEDGRIVIAALEKILPTVPDDYEALPKWLILYGINIMQLRDEGNVEDICKAIVAQEKAVRLADDSKPSKPLWLKNLGDVYAASFLQTGSEGHLERSIELFQKASDLGGDAIPDIYTLLDSFGSALLQRFLIKEDLQDLNDGITHQRKAVVLSPPGFSETAGYHRKFGLLLKHRFDRKQSIEDLSEAILAFQNARQLNPPQYQSNLPIILSELGPCLRERFKISGNLQDIDEAIINLQGAVAMVPKSHSSVPNNVTELAFCLSLRFYRLGNLQDINQAIALQRRILQVASVQGSLRAGWLSNLGLFLSRRFERTADLTDITEAIHEQRKAVAMTSEGDHNLSVYLANLGRSYGCRYDQVGDISDISEAIVILQKAIDLPLGEKAICYNNLANAFRSRYEQTGEISDIQEAISAQQRAVEGLGEHDIYLPGWMFNLGHFLYRKRTLHIISKDHAIYPRQLQSLGSTLMTRFQLLKDVNDINEAISLQQQSIELLPDHHPQSHQFLGNLGNSYNSRFNELRDIDDIKKTVQVQRTALKLCPTGNLPELVTRFSALANALKIMSEVSGSKEDLDESIDISGKAIGLLPKGHIRLSTNRFTLALALRNRFRHHGANKADLVEATQNFRTVATSVGFSWLRFDAAEGWISGCWEGAAGDWEEACDCAIHLLSLHAGMEQTVEGRHRRLQETSRMVAPIVATAIAYGESSRALEWLEEGRCIVWNQINQLRTPLDELRAKHPGVAEQFHKVRRALDSASGVQVNVGMAPTMTQKFASQDQITLHVRLAKEWERLLGEIRALPDFQDFLQPKKVAYLMSNIPQDGIVVIINSHTTPCSALALVAGADEPITIELPQMDYKRLKRKLEGFLFAQNVRSRGDHRAVRRVKLSDSNALRDVLRSLWTNVTKPIFDALAFGDPPVQPKRLWWCVMGALSFLPVHAAGIYEPHGRSVSDYVVSSYIPSLGVLIEKAKAKHRSSPQVMLVSQPNTPGLDPIPGTAKEVENIRRRLQESGFHLLGLHGKEAVASRVREAMRGAGWVHLACHAFQDARNPLDSGFYLEDARITLSDIMKESIECADFAYLSACQTSTGAEELSEEAAHLAAGMLAAGYRSVVATMWSIQDKFAEEIADNFYKFILETDDKRVVGHLSSGKAPYALHWATKKIRETYGNSDIALLACIPYVHFGY
ncbi:CHAT domain-containing protein [Crepidotus variabilis]|uniref:CHAT domain-containing protein n=1 Tax=Crepidotus variabilis TaxID=179855 RepID=A0A9P6EEK6_9AGAR|nr:CHAT domain-containing protein [Crepidotus variabilis]